MSRALDTLNAVAVATAGLERRAPVWSCRDCGANFSTPSETDASDVVHDHETGPRYEFVTLLVCPRCYSERIAK